MTEWNKKRNHDHKPEPRDQREEGDSEAENEKWLPTPAAFQAFQVRDEALATGNIRLVLNSRSPVSLKEIKDSTLHSTDVIERVITSGLASGTVVENKGKYSLAPRTVAAR